MDDFVKAGCPDFDLSKGVYLKASEISRIPRVIHSNLPLPLHSSKLLDNAKVRAALPAHTANSLTNSLATEFFCSSIFGRESSSFSLPTL